MNLTHCVSEIPGGVKVLGVIFQAFVDPSTDQAVFRGCLRSIQYFARSPLAPLKKGGTGIKVPLFKGDLGGSTSLEYNTKKFSDILLAKEGLQEV